MKKIRKAQASDANFILKLIKELADFEKSLNQVSLSLDCFLKDGFGKSPLFKSLIIELNKIPVGFALYYNRYSTWKGKALYLEDLFIIPEARGNGLGKQTLKYLAEEAVSTGCERFEWQVLDWNEPAIKLYKKLGAELDSGWINCRLEGPKLKSFGVSK